MNGLYLENLMSSMELIDIWLGGNRHFNRELKIKECLIDLIFKRLFKELLKSGRFCLTWSENQKF